MENSKECKCCKKVKSFSDFNRSRSRKDKLRSYCKECEREHAREFYQNNPGPYKARAKEHKKLLKEYLQNFSDNYKVEKGCYFCKEKTLCVLDYHHVEKGKPVTRQISNSYVAFERELNKCIVVCANCHRKIHHGMLKADSSMLCVVKVKRRTELACAND